MKVTQPMFPYPNDEGPLALAHHGRVHDDLGILPVHEVVESADGGGWHGYSLISD